MKNKYRNRILLITVIAMLIAAYTYFHAKDEIVIHWDFNGNADGYAPKLILLAAPLLIPLIDWLMVLIMKTEPRKNNIQKSKAGYATVRFVTAAILFTCTVFTCVEALYPKTLKIEIIAPFLVGVMIIIIGNVLPKIRSNYSVGIRNRWTLENEIIWRKTQRLSGRLWFGGGFAICMFSLSQNINRLVLLLIIFIIILFPNLYAYYLYQRMRKPTI